MWRWCTLINIWIYTCSQILIAASYIVYQCSCVHSQGDILCYKYSDIHPLCYDIYADIGQVWHTHLHLQNHTFYITSETNHSCQDITCTSSILCNILTTATTRTCVRANCVCTDIFTWTGSVITLIDIYHWGSVVMCNDVKHLYSHWPLHLVPSKVYPLLQLHWKLPTVLLHIWLHGDVLLHSSTSNKTTQDIH